MRLEELSFNPKYRGNLNGTNKGQAWSDLFFFCKTASLVFLFCRSEASVTRAHSNQSSSCTFPVLINNDDKQYRSGRAARLTSCPGLTFTFYPV